MAFRPRRALAVFWKDFLDLRKNPALLLSMMVLPAGAGRACPSASSGRTCSDPDDSNLRVIALYYDPTLPLGRQRGALPGRADAAWTGSACSW